MPLGNRYYGKRKRTTPTRKFVKRRKTMRRFRRVPRPKFTGWGKKVMAKLRYVDYITIDPPSAGVASYVFRATSLFDPDVTGTGHQPMGFDQLMNRYDHYTVVGAKLTAQFMPVSAANLVPGLLGCLLSDTGTRVASATSISHLLEHPGRGSIANTGVLLPKDYNARVIKKFSSKKFFGKKTINENDYRGTNAASPTENAFFEVYVATVGTNNPDLTTLLVTIDYIALFTEPKPLAQS